MWKKMKEILCTTIITLCLGMSVVQVAIGNSDNRNSPPLNNFGNHFPSSGSFLGRQEDSQEQQYFLPSLYQNRFVTNSNYGIPQVFDSIIMPIPIIYPGIVYLLRMPNLPHPSKCPYHEENIQGNHFQQPILGATTSSKPGKRPTFILKSIEEVNRIAREAAEKEGPLISSGLKYKTSYQDPRLLITTTPISIAQSDIPKTENSKGYQDPRIQQKAHIDIPKTENSKGYQDPRIQQKAQSDIPKTENSKGYQDPRIKQKAQSDSKGYQDPRIQQKAQSDSKGYHDPRIQQKAQSDIPETINSKAYQDSRKQQETTPISKAQMDVPNTENSKD